MAITTEYKFPVPFASEGDKTTIPVDDADEKIVSLKKGFSALFSKDLSNGGEFVKRKDINGILNAITASLAFLQQGGIQEFDSSYASAIGGYSKGARLWAKISAYGDEYQLVESVSDNNLSAPTDANTDVTGSALKWKTIAPSRDASKRVVFKGNGLVLEGATTTDGCPDISASNNSDYAFANKKYVNSQVSASSFFSLASNVVTLVKDYAFKVTGALTTIGKLTVGDASHKNGAEIFGNLALNGATSTSGCPDIGTSNNADSAFANKKYVLDRIADYFKSKANNVITLADGMGMSMPGGLTATSATINGNVSTSGTLTVGTSTVNKATTLNGNLTATGNTTLGGSGKTFGLASGTTTASGCPTPTQNSHFANKQYVDNAASNARSAWLPNYAQRASITATTYTAPKNGIIYARGTYRSLGTITIDGAGFPWVMNYGDGSSWLWMSFWVKKDSTITFDGVYDYKYFVPCG